jgi:hypothetical protein
MKLAIRDTSTYNIPDLLVNHTDNQEYEWEPSDLINNFNLFVNLITVFKR